MFPVQLMTVRRGKNGVVRSVFLTADSSDYCRSVLNLFKDSIGLRREDIETRIKELELKSQNPKIVRGLSLIMFRKSNLEAPSFLEPSKIRSMIFTSARYPAVSPEERDAILQNVAENLGTTPDEVRNAMYADKESEQILKTLPDMSPEELASRFNMEQVETLMLKSQSIMIVTESSLPIILRKIRSLGLLHEIKSDGNLSTVTVSGPLSVMDHTERYGSRIASLVHFLFSISGWSLEAKVRLGHKDQKADYSYYIDDSSVEYFGHWQREKPYPSGFGPPFSIDTGGNPIFPDLSVRIDGNDVAVFITRPIFYEEDKLLVRRAREAGVDADLFCVVEKGEKCPSGARCFRDEPDFHAILDFLKQTYDRARRDHSSERGAITKGRLENTGRLGSVTHHIITDNVKKHLDDLYPNSQAMVDYLDFMGLDPAVILEMAGYNVKWRGLRIEVSRNPDSTGNS